MTASWQQLAESITFDANRVNQQSRHNTTLIPLNRLSTLSVTGNDAERFLQGQLTCDMRAVTTESIGLGSHCTPKGRVISNFYLYRHDTGFNLHLPQELAATQHQALKKYSVFFKTELTLKDEEIVGFGLAGANVKTQLGALKQYLPAIFQQLPVPGQRVYGDEITICHLPGACPRYAVWTDPSTAASLWSTLAEEIPCNGFAHWQLLDIEAGYPQLTDTNSESFTPHQLNLPALGGVSFNKGCYTGQEIVARMEYRGKAKSRLFRLGLDQLETHLETVASTTPIYGENSSAGEVVVAAAAGTNQMELLAVVKENAIESGKIYLDEARQQPLTCLELPYSLDKE